MRGPTWNFIQHLVEMVVAMFVGMFALGMPAGMLFDALGWTAVTDQTVPATLLMATYMTIGMAAWMLVRGCGWLAIRDMALAMYLAFAVTYPLYWTGWASTMTVMVVGHVLMVPAMVLAMLLRKDEYTRAADLPGRSAVARPPARELAVQPEG